MFKKNARLSRSEFSEYFAKGKRHHFPNFTIITVPHPSLKVSVVVGKKVVKSAVKRNKYKRRIYAQMRTLSQELELKGIFIIITKPSYNSLLRKTSSEMLAQAMTEVLKTINKTKV